MDTMQFLEPYKIFFNNKPHDQNFTIPGTYRSLTIYKVSEISLESDFLKKKKNLLLNNSMFKGAQYS